MRIFDKFKFTLLISLLLLSHGLSAQNSSSESKDISGTITYLNEPVKDVNITIENTSKGTKTDAKGYYFINANVGDKLVFTHIGFNPIEIVVEDITKVLNLDLTENVNKLDEVIIETNTKDPENSSIGNYSRIVNTSLGNVNPMLLAGARHFSVERIATQYRTLSDALKFYYPKGLPTKNFDVDGVLHWGEPFVDMSTVRDIYYVPSYPSNKLDPLNKSVIIIRTTHSEEYREIIAEKYRNQNYYAEDAVAVEAYPAVNASASNLTTKQNIKRISGKITYLGSPIPDVNILIKDTSKGSTTNTQGFFSLNAKIADVLVFSHASYQNVHIVVEDVTTVLNLEMIDKVNLLDEAVVVARKDQKSISLIEEKMAVELQTSFGVFRPKAAATKVHYLSGKDIGHHYHDLAEALKGKFSGKLPTTLDVDGIPYKIKDFRNLSSIIDVYVTKNVIVVRTMYSPEEIAQRQEEKAESYRNQNYYQEDAIAVNQEAIVSSKSDNLNTTNGFRTIAGKITFLGTPVPDVNIKIAKTTRGTKTDSKGEYSIKAKAGDILVYSHVSYKTVEVVVEDISAVLDIEMVEKTNQLKEAVVTARKPLSRASRIDAKLNTPFNTAIGTINPRASGYDIKYIEGKELNLGALTLAKALEGKFAGVSVPDKLNPVIVLIRNRPALWDIDGQILKEDPGINIGMVEEIFILKQSPAAYGGGPVIVVKTTANTLDKIQEQNEKIAEQHRNQNYYTDDAISLENTSKEISKGYLNNKNVRTISGMVTYLGEAVPDVTITVKNAPRGTKTDRNGRYAIDAKSGEILNYSHVSFQSVSVVIEDITTIINIEMVDKTNELDEVVVIAKTANGEVVRHSKQANKKFDTSRGIVNPDAAGYAVGFVDGKEITNLYGTLKEALVGKISGYYIDKIKNKAYLRGGNSSVTNDYPVAWDVDGVFTQDEPIGLDASQIKSVHALKSLAATNKYGSLGAGGVIVIQTKSGDFSVNNSNSKIAEQHRNQSYYANDAASMNIESMSTNEFTDRIKGLNDIQKGYQFYEQSVLHQVTDYQIHIASAVTFSSYYNSPNLATQILLGLSKKHANNPEKLKAIAYNMQAIGSHMEAVYVYENIFRLRPKYAQSYRDLANAYINHSQFKKGWRLYMSYLMQGHNATNDDIGQIVYNEMEYLYFNRANQTQIKEKFEPKSEDHEAFKNDVRIIFEWNTSEAEFDLEFVSPDKRAYVFEHTLAANQELITDEKQKGYSSKEFFIEDVGTGEWLVNFTYKGNKKPEPTYLKATTIYHWGTSSQKKQVSVYKFNTERNKFQLIHINQQQLLASN